MLNDFSVKTLYFVKFQSIFQLLLIINLFECYKISVSAPVAANMSENHWAGFIAFILKIMILNKFCQH